MSATRWALLVSLAANVLLAGVIAGGGIAALRHPHAGADTAVARAPNMRVLMDSLPPARAAEVRSRVVDTWKGARTERLAARQARLDVARVAGADPYDEAAAKAAFARMRVADAAVAARLHEAVADAMATMTPQERRAMLRHLAQRRMAQRGMMRGRLFGPQPVPDPETPPPATTP